MFIKRPEKFNDVNVIFELPTERVYLGELKFDSKVIGVEERIANIYVRDYKLKEQKNENSSTWYTARVVDDDRVEIEKREGDYKCCSCFVIDRLSTDDYLLSTNRILNGFTFIISKRNAENVSLKKYKISKTLGGEDYTLNLEEELLFYFENKNLKLSLDEKEITIDDLDKFYEKVDYEDNLITKHIASLIYDNYSSEKGFLDIEKDFKQVISDYIDVPYEKIYKYLYYFGQYDFYLTVERLIKSDLKKNILECNPAMSKQSLDTISDIKILSNSSKKIMDNYGLNYCFMLELEQNSKIGKNGIKEIDDFIKLINSIRSKSDGYSKSFALFRADYMFNGIKKILNTFDISLKVLLNRIAKAMLIEEINMSDYINNLVDIIEMAKQSNIKLDKKLPTDIMRLHDLLSEQLVYRLNENTEKAFSSLHDFNSVLLENMPVSESLTILVPNSPKDLINEGLKLNHCVGSYIERYINGYSKIYFVRKKSSIEQPFVTVELDKYNRLVQAKAYSNKMPNKEIMEFINKWIENIEKVGK